MLLTVSGHSLPPQELSAADSDRDGIADTLEQALLNKFRPTFFVARSECDQLPASFRDDSTEPIVVARDGSIYGQAFRSVQQPASGVRVELHYYHLWGRDCGRNGHNLDTEHVSVLVTAPAADSPVSDWKAVYWYAAAHQGTVCEASLWSSAESMRATENGAKVWISAGKHASYFAEALCRGGCGGDRCDQPREIPAREVVNIGERGAPMNGAAWAASSKWTLSQKMVTDFPEKVLAELKNTHSLEMKHNGSMQAVILGGGDAMAGLAIGGEHTADGLDTGKKHTGRALGTAYTSVKKALKWAFTGGGKPNTPPANTQPPAKSEEGR